MSEDVVIQTNQNRVAHPNSFVCSVVCRHVIDYAAAMFGDFLSCVKQGKLLEKVLFCLEHKAYFSSEQPCVKIIGARRYMEQTRASRGPTIVKPFLEGHVLRFEPDVMVVDFERQSCAPECVHVWC
eukprot:4506620-Amphidinium_carterae.1